jgi:enamine deaminase RidA (YjgF/YER057c/UK114 family)
MGGVDAAGGDEAILAKIVELGRALPVATKPAGAYVPVRRVDRMLFVSGQIPSREGQLIARGSVPSEVSVETAQECARQCVLNALAAIRQEIGTLSKVRKFVRLGVFVCSDKGFYEQPKVGNGASELLVAIFGENGRHARAAVGSIALPLGAPVEVEMVVEVE